MVNTLSRPLRRAAGLALRTRRRVRDERLKRRFASAFLPDRAALATYERELQASGLLEHLRSKGREFDEAVRDVPGPRHTIGAIAYLEGINLYAVLRTVKPHIAVETGVCNGFSTAFSLLALERNGHGELHSIDLPRMIGTDYVPGTFFEGKGQAGVPEGKQPGWLVPDHLRHRWSLILGRSDEHLPELLERVGTIDSFLHDSEHSFENMWFEYSQAFPALREGGVLMSHDINTTEAFPRFAAEHGREPIDLSRGMALIVK
ncbi:MAG: class I SAM-dependent methyltransferase [Actinobacteria bacterium]|nr:class I SAM-dependent methyltransferase [Actinomycetota bacterium]